MAPAVLGIAWLLSLGVVFVLGILSAFAFHRAPESVTDPRMDRFDRDLAFTVESLTGEPADLAALKSVSARDAFPVQLERALDHLAGMESGGRRVFYTEALTRGLPMRPVVASVQHIAGQPPTEGRQALCLELLRRWGELDGRSAVAFAASRMEEGMRIASVEAALRGWARVNADDAWGWAMRQEAPAEVRGAWLSSVLRAEAHEDLESAVTRVGGLEDPRLEPILMRTMTDWLVETMGGDRALPWLAELDADGLPLDLIVYFARRWAEFDPWMAVDWASGLEGAAREEVYSAVAAQWASRDPSSAAHWAYGLPQGAERMTLLRQIAGQWIRLEGLEAPTEWLAARGPDPNMDGAIEAVVVALVEANPAAAFSWAMSIADPARREIAATAVGRYWLDVDADAALPIVAREMPSVLPREVVPEVETGPPEAELENEGLWVDDEGYVLPPDQDDEREEGAGEEEGALPEDDGF